jgi:hypothetical protein
VAQEQEIGLWIRFRDAPATLRWSDASGVSSHPIRIFRGQTAMVSCQAVYPATDFECVNMTR